MKFRQQTLCVLPVLVLACSLLPVPAEAQFTQQGPKLVGTGSIGNASQGDSVSLSGDGYTAIAGGADDNNFVRAAWVFTRSDGVWTQQAKLVGTGAVGLAGQGWSVSLSGDGNTAVVGGPFDDNPFLETNFGTGAAWVFTRSGSVWTQQAKLVSTGILDLALQGSSVSLSGDGNTAIVGGQLDDFGVGASWVFTRSDGFGASWARSWSAQAR
jgi:FG-GAP repeat